MSIEKKLASGATKTSAIKKLASSNVTPKAAAKARATGAVKSVAKKPPITNGKAFATAKKEQLASKRAGLAKQLSKYQASTAAKDLKSYKGRVATTKNKKPLY